MAKEVVAVFGSSTVTSESTTYQDAYRLGRLLAEKGFVVANGGYAGVMEAVSSGAASAGGVIHGYTTPKVFPERSGGNAFLTREIQSRTLLDRVRKLVANCHSAIALSGSTGTLLEVAAVWQLNSIGPKTRRLITVGQAWRDVVDALVENMAVDPALVTWVATIEDAVEVLEADRTGRLIHR